MWREIILCVVLVAAVFFYIKERKEKRMLIEEKEYLKKRYDELYEKEAERKKNLKKNVATLYLYGQLIEEAAHSVRMKEYSEIILYEVRKLMEMTEESV